MDNIQKNFRLSPDICEKLRFLKAKNSRLTETAIVEHAIEELFLKANSDLEKTVIAARLSV